MFTMKSDVAAYDTRGNEERASEMLKTASARTRMLRGSANVNETEVRPPAKKTADAWSVWEKKPRVLWQQKQWNQKRARARAALRAADPHPLHGTQHVAEQLEALASWCQHAELMRGLGEAERRQVCRFCQLLEVDAGETVFAEGDQKGFVYVIFEGRAAMYAQNVRSGREVKALEFEEADSFGGGGEPASIEVAASDFSKSASVKARGTVIALTPCVLLVVSRSKDLALLKAQAEAMYAPRLEFLKNSALFRNATERTIEKFVCHLRVKFFDEGEIVTREGAAPEFCYFCSEGRLQACLVHRESAEVADLKMQLMGLEASRAGSQNELDELLESVMRDGRIKDGKPHLDPSEESVAEEMKSVIGASMKRAAALQAKVDGAQEVLAVFHVNDNFGEVGAVMNQTRSASIVAVERSVLYCLPGITFKTLMEEDLLMGIMDSATQAQGKPRKSAAKPTAKPARGGGMSSPRGKGKSARQKRVAAGRPKWKTPAQLTTKGKLEPGPDAAHNRVIKESTADWSRLRGEIDPEAAAAKRKQDRSLGVRMQHSYGHKVPGPDAQPALSPRHLRTRLRHESGVRYSSVATAPRTFALFSPSNPRALEARAKAHRGARLPAMESARANQQTVVAPDSGASAGVLGHLSLRRLEQSTREIRM